MGQLRVGVLAADGKVAGEAAPYVKSSAMRRSWRH